MKKAIAAISFALISFCAQAAQTTAATQPWVNQRIRTELTNFLNSAALTRKMNGAIGEQMNFIYSQPTNGFVSTATNTLLAVQSTSITNYPKYKLFAPQYGGPVNGTNWYVNVRTTPQLKIWYVGESIYSSTSVFGAVIPATGETFHESIASGGELYLISDEDSDRFVEVAIMRGYEANVRACNTFQSDRR